MTETMLRDGETFDLFGIDAESPADVFRGVHDPRNRWNGWANPRFPRSEAERIAAWSNRMAEEYGEDCADRFEWDGDVLVRLDCNFDEGEEPQRYRIEPDAQGFYAVGYYGWCWSELGNDHPVAAAWYAQRVEAEILQDIAAGILPVGVASFQDLHDHVDANEYLAHVGVPVPADVEGALDLTNAVQDIVHEWLAAGAHREALPADVAARTIVGAACSACGWTTDDATVAEVVNDAAYCPECSGPDVTVRMLDGTTRTRKDA